MLNSRSPLSLRDLTSFANVRVWILRVQSFISTGESRHMAVRVSYVSVGVFPFPAVSGDFLGVVWGNVWTGLFIWFAWLLTIEVRISIWLCSSF